MTFVQRNRLRAALAVLLAAVSVLVLLTRLHYAPVLAQLAALKTKCECECEFEM